MAAAVLEGAGLDPQRIVYESVARDSCEHPARVRELVRPAPGETWVVVTSAMHMPRVVGCFRASGWSDVVAYPTDHRVVAGDWDRGTFRMADNLALLDTALHEWVGLAYYRLTGRIAEIFDPGPLHYAPFDRAVSSAVEHCFHTAGVSGSIPLPPTSTRRRIHGESATCTG